MQTRLHRISQILLPVTLFATLLAREATPQGRGAAGRARADGLARRIASQTLLSTILSQGNSAQALELPDLPILTRLASALCCGPDAVSPDQIKILAFRLEVLDGLSTEVTDVDRHIAVAARNAADTSAARMLELQRDGSLRSLGWMCLLLNHRS